LSAAAAPFQPMHKAKITAVGNDFSWLLLIDTGRLARASP